MTDLQDLLFTFLLAAGVGLVFCVLIVGFESFEIRHTSLHHNSSGSAATINPRSCLSDKEIRKMGKKKVGFGDDPALKEQPERKVDEMLRDGVNWRKKQKEWEMEEGEEGLSAGWGWKFDETIHLRDETFL